MSAHDINRHVRISISQRNILLVNNELPSVEGMTPAQFDHVIRIGHDVISGALDAMHRAACERNPRVQRGSMWLLHLSQTESDVVSPLALDRASKATTNRNIFSEREDVAERYRPYFEVLRLHNLLPEICSNENSVACFTGVFLLARGSPLL